jgi:hypothetical protein
MKRQQRRALERDIERTASKMLAWAKTWEFNGEPNQENHNYITLSRRVHSASGAVVIFTRDTGHHTSGWIKNPDYERCYHLSLSPIQGYITRPDESYGVELDQEITFMWCKAFFREHLRLAWSESPKSALGRAHSVWHWRVFANEAWEPIKPHGELYSTELTEKGWKSASEVLELTGRPEPISTVDPS